MSWEAFRLTSKSPSELYDVLGPAGVDGMIRQALLACWNALPPEGRTFAAWRRLAQAVFDRNMGVWSKIKKPTPQAFFEDLRPDPADGHLRQAMVMCWMMLPRAGGRDFRDVRKIVTAMFERDLQSWADDDATFTKGPGKRAAVRKPVAKKKGRVAAKKTTAKKSKPSRKKSRR